MGRWAEGEGSGRWGVPRRILQRELLQLGIVGPAAAAVGDHPGGVPPPPGGLPDVLDPLCFGDKTVFTAFLRPGTPQRILGRCGDSSAPLCQSSPLGMPKSIPQDIRPMDPPREPPKGPPEDTPDRCIVSRWGGGEGEREEEEARGKGRGGAVEDCAWRQGQGMWIWG